MLKQVKFMFRLRHARFSKSFLPIRTEKQYIKKIHILGGVGKVKNAKRDFEKIISVAGRGNKVKSTDSHIKNRFFLYVYMAVWPYSNFDHG